MKPSLKEEEERRDFTGCTLRKKTQSFILAPHERDLRRITYHMLNIIPFHSFQGLNVHPMFSFRKRNMMIEVGSRDSLNILNDKQENYKWFSISIGLFCQYLFLSKPLTHLFYLPSVGIILLQRENRME